MYRYVTPLLISAVIWASIGQATAQGVPLPDFDPCSPTSESAPESAPDRLGLDSTGFPASLNFCSEWNPEFPYNGHHCCGRIRPATHRRVDRCWVARAKSTFCDERTPEQLEYAKAVQAGQKDVLSVITEEMGRRAGQSYCTVNNGFLAWGRPIVPTLPNRLQLRREDRCTNFGTDGMAGLMEWLGRQVAKEYPAQEYSRMRLLIGDVAAPRGGCLAGKSGRKGHASHTTGQDADVGFLSARPNEGPPASFTKTFDPKANWWLLKQVFKNPYACIKIVFLDRTLIRKLSRVAANDEDWLRYRRFIRHMRGHRNHLHVRIGDGPGQPGCIADARPELEVEEDGS